MKQLEIILTRTSFSSGEYPSRLRWEFEKMAKEIQIPDATFGFYANADDPGDLAFIVLFSSNRPDNEKSREGILIADAMKRFGLVSHACWIAADAVGLPRLLMEKKL